MAQTYHTHNFGFKPTYDNSALRGIDEPRPWDLSKEILFFAGKEKQLLDIGCGSGLKLSALAPYFSWITGLDYNAQMLKLAIARLKGQEIANFSVIEGHAKNLPFADENFDVVTSMMAPHDLLEIHRVLKPGGNLIIETYGELDKKSLKDFFVDDQKKPRGQLSDRAPGTTKASYENELAPLYSDIMIQEGFWNTHYTEEGILALLMNTPTVVGFNVENDKIAFEKAISALASSKDTITLTQHRLLIKAKKLLLK